MELRGEEVTWIRPLGPAATKFIRALLIKEMVIHSSDLLR